MIRGLVMTKRTQCFQMRLSVAAYAWLVGEAARLGVSAAELLRRIVDDRRAAVTLNGRVLTRDGVPLAVGDLRVGDFIVVDPHTGETWPHAA